MIKFSLEINFRSNNCQKQLRSRNSFLMISNDKCFLFFFYGWNMDFRSWLCKKIWIGLRQILIEFPENYSDCMPKGGLNWSEKDWIFFQCPYFNFSIADQAVIFQWQKSKMCIFWPTLYELIDFTVL
jgi:hypothetical protein